MAEDQIIRGSEGQGQDSRPLKRDAAEEPDLGVNVICFSNAFVSEITTTYTHKGAELDLIKIFKICSRTP